MLEDAALLAFNGQLQAIDAHTGKSILSFGKNGLVDLRQGLGRDPATIRRVMSSMSALPNP